jgi:hypothetical protein
MRQMAFQSTKQFTIRFAWQIQWALQDFTGLYFLVQESQGLAYAVYKFDDRSMNGMPFTDNPVGGLNITDLTDPNPARVLFSTARPCTVNDFASGVSLIFPLEMDSPRDQVQFTFDTFDVLGMSTSPVRIPIPFGMDCWKAATENYYSGIFEFVDHFDFGPSPIVFGPRRIPARLW